MPSIQLRRRSRLMSGAATGMILAMASGAAYAQTAQKSGEVEELVVTGIRASIENSIAVKKADTSIVEAVSAEDIGKLPDISIAESIARLPGIAAQRTNGRAQSLSIRGLGPDFTVTTLNGREQVSTNNNRSVEFDQYPSELISQVVVFKTPNAGMTTQGIAGTADLRTTRPLTTKGRTLALSYRHEVNDAGALVNGSDKSGDRFGVTYIDKFMDDTFGVALGYSYTKSPTQTKRLEAWGYPDLNSTTKVIGGTKPAVQSSYLQRDGVMAVLDWQPTDRFHAVLDAYHTSFEELQRNNRLEFPLQWSGASLQPGYTVSDGLVQSGTYTGVKTVVENYVTKTTAKTDNIGLNVSYDLTDNWALEADLAHNKVTRHDIQIESTAGTGPGGSGALDTVKFRMTPEGVIVTPTLNYSDFNTIFLTDPGGWGGPIPAGKFRAGYVKEPRIEDELTSIRLSAKRELDTPIVNSVSFGVNRNERSKSKVGLEGYMLLNAAQASIPTQFRQGSTNVSFFGPTSGMVQYDALGLYNSGFFGFAQETGTDAVKRSWSVEETVDTFYVMADINTTFMNVPVTGNIGLQAQHADQSGTSAFTDGTATGTKLVKSGTSYTDYLPSLNLNFAIAENTSLRVGLGKTLSRPRMDDLSSGVNYSPVADGGSPTIINGTPFYWTGGGGNPNLKPWKATAFDLSLERYFGGKGYVSLAYYYKKLDSFIYSTNVLRDFSGIALPTTGSYTLASANRLGVISGMANGEGGSLQGLELSASVPFSLISEPLDGFGLIFSAAVNRSSVDPGDTGNKIDLPGLSKKVVNTTLYYEKYGFSARVSSRYRGDFVGEVPDYQNSLEQRWVRAENVIDAQVSYQLQSGPAKGLTLILQGNNLTDEGFTTTEGKDSALTRKYEEYGTTYSFGVNYKF